MAKDIVGQSYARRVLRKQPTLQKFGFVSASILACAVITLLGPGVSHASDLPVVHESGTLTENQTWSAGSVYLIDDTVTVPTGVTLTIGHGAIIKYASVFSGSITVDGGELDVTGTSGDPVIFTSSQDDSVGGDSTSNGATTGTAGDYNRAIYQNAGTINVAYAHFQYANSPIGSSAAGSHPDAGPLTVNDSSFSDMGYGLAIDHAGDASLARNVFDLASGSGQWAMRLLSVSDLTHVVLSGPDENTFSGTRAGGKLVYINGSVPSGETMTVAAASGAMLEPVSVDVAGTLNLSDSVTYSYGYEGGVIAEAGGTVNIPAGAVYKVDTNYSSHGFKGVVVNGGTLNVTGTGTNPVIFTSGNDDSVGGDSAGDGATAGTAGDYGNAVYEYSGTVNITHVQFEYADNPIASYFAGSFPDAGSLVVTDSSFSSMGSGLAIDYAGAITLAHNNFDLDSGSGQWAIRLLDAPDLSQVVLSGSDRNTFSGTRIGGRLLYVNGSVPSGETLAIDSASGAILEPVGIDVAGTLNLSSGVTYSDGTSGGITVEAGGTVNIPAGAVYKVDTDYSSHEFTGIQVNGGTLNVAGTGTNPVIFTSGNDDTVGGDSDGQGPTSGSAGDYSNAIYEAGGTVNLAHAVVKYAKVPVENVQGDGNLTISDSTLSGVDSAFYMTSGQANLVGVVLSDASQGVQLDGGNLIFRGSFTNVSGRRIEACNWDTTGCAVDAAYVDWGSSDGPLATDPANNLVCGAVSIMPWVHGGTDYSGATPNLYSVRNCDNSVSTPDTTLNSAIAGFQDGVSSKEIDCSGGYQDACDAIQSAYACLGGAMDTAQSTTPWPLPGSSTAEDVDAFGGLVRSSAATYMTSQEIVAPSGFALDYFNNLIGLAGTFVTMANAYSSCIP